MPAWQQSCVLGRQGTILRQQSTPAILCLGSIASEKYSSKTSILTPPGGQPENKGMALLQRTTNPFRSPTDDRAGFGSPRRARHAPQVHAVRIHVRKSSFPGASRHLGFMSDTTPPSEPNTLHGRPVFLGASRPPSAVKDLFWP